jgi:hypothetical protein
MDYEIGLHGQICAQQQKSTFGTHEAVRRQEDDPDASSLPFLFAHSPKQARTYLAYQAPPHVRAFTLESNPIVAALELSTLSHWLLDVSMPPLDSPVKATLHGADSSGASLLIVPRLSKAAYVLLGEDIYDVVHAEGSHPAHRFVGGENWDAVRSPLDLVAYCTALGHVLGNLHFQSCLDGFGFSVVGGTREGEGEQRLYVQCDPRQVRSIDFDRIATDVNVVDRLSFIFGRLAYVPAPRQEMLFKAFASGYRTQAKSAGLDSYATAVLDRMRVYVE